MSSEKWRAEFAPGGDPSYRIIGLPYAGGGTTSYARWGRFLGPRCQIVALRLPGRETRWGEQLIRSMDELIEILVRDFSPLLDRPFAIHGHSMGGRIGFELARALRLNALPQPTCLFVSASRPPHRPKRSRPLHAMPDADFIAALTSLYDGIPRAVLEDEQLLRLFLPTIRSDIELFESATYLDDHPLDCPIVAIAGTEDKAVRRADIEEWRLHTRASFTALEMTGGHFFLNDHSEAIATLVRDVMERRMDAHTQPESVQKCARQPIHGFPRSPFSDAY